MAFKIATSDARGGLFSGLVDRMLGGGAHRGSKTGKASPLAGLYLGQLVPALLIVVLGVITQWTASSAIENANFTSHLAGIAIGVAGAAVVWRYDYRALSGLTLPLFVLACVLMVLPKVPGLGFEGGLGMVGWVKIGFFRFQPSEPGKIVIILLMASAAAQYNGKIDTLRDYIKLCATLAIPFVLMMVTDLGTSLVMFVSGALVIVCSGAPKRWILATVALVVGVATLVVVTSMVDIPGVPHVLKDYQLKRLLVFTDPSLDPTGDGYNLQQSKIAVGSGGFLGKGVGNASQSLTGFTPEAHTDFVFALFAEQFGFVGSVVLIGLFFWMIFSTLLLAMRIDSLFAKLVLVGCASMWMFQVVESVGMCTGIMPITGIPLPFMSFGSSSMVTQMAAVGLVQSVWRHRQKAA